jgi:cobalt/nickel transport system permease protein
MHIADGILPVSVLAGGWALSAVGVGIGLKRLDGDRLPQVAVISSAFFVASLIHLPVPGTSVHLVLNGLAGMVLGWAVFPALMVALFLQAILFGHGGLTALGVNTLNMALPAVVCWYLFNGGRLTARVGRSGLLGAAAGATGFALAGVMTAGCLALAGKGFLQIAMVVLLVDLLAIGIEALITGSAVSFVLKVRPELLVAGGILGDTTEVRDATS